MRMKQELFELEEVTTLLQYLYMSEDHSIIYNNGLTNLEVKMTENYGFTVLNHSFEDLGWATFTDMMTVPYMLGVINRLKETNPLEPDLFKTRWEEIKTITSANMGLNYSHYNKF